MRNVAQVLGIGANSVLKHQAQVVISIGELYMDSKYKILGGQQAAVGYNARADNVNQISSSTLNDAALDEIVS